MGIRTTLQERLLDRVQYLVDSRPRLDYQPLPWIGEVRAGRASGSAERWELMAPEIERLGPATAVDIGSNVGSFSLMLAERGISVVAIEGHPRHFRITQHAARRAGFANVGFVYGCVDPDSVWQVPPADVTLPLSVHHHWVRFHGQGSADDMLAAVWANTSKALFFETGEGELPGRYRAADLGDDPRAGLSSHLERVCEGAVAVCLGTSRAFAPGDRHEDAGSASRHLFIVERP